MDQLYKKGRWQENAEEAIPVTGTKNPFVNFRGPNNSFQLIESDSENSVEEPENEDDIEKENEDGDKPYKLLTHFNGEQIEQVWSDGTRKTGVASEGKHGFVVCDFEDGENFESMV